MNQETDGRAAAKARDILTGLATSRFPPALPTEQAFEGSIELF
jgi:hypothetical protein